MAPLKLEEEWWEPGRLAGDPLDGLQQSRRVGPGGRTFHCRVQSMTRKTGGAARAIAGLDYDAREGRHSGRSDELESEGGRDREEMATILQAAEAANTRKNGK